MAKTKNNADSKAVEKKLEDYAGIVFEFLFDSLAVGIVFSFCHIKTPSSKAVFQFIKTGAFLQHDRQILLCVYCDNRLLATY